MINILPEEEMAEEEVEEGISEEWGGRQTQTEKSDLHCIHCNKHWHDASTCKLPWDKIEQQINQEKAKTHDRDKGKAPDSAHYVVAHCNNGEIEDLSDVSFTSWRND